MTDDIPDTTSRGDKDQWTRRDMPDVHRAMQLSYDPAGLRYKEHYDTGNRVLDAVVQELNDRYPKPEREVSIGEAFTDKGVAMIRQTLDGLQRTRDNLNGQVARQAATIASLQSDRNEALRREGVMKRERDAAVERANKAEKRRDDWERSYDALLSTITDNTDWRERALLAEDRLAVYHPEITRADIEKIVSDIEMVRQTHGFNPPATPESELVRRLHSLVSGNDPAVHVVRESDVEAVKVKHQANHWVVEDVRVWGDLIPAEAARNESLHLAKQIAAAEAVARAIEAEQAVDPVEAKAEVLSREVFECGLSDLASDTERLVRMAAAHAVEQEARSDE